MAVMKIVVRSDAEFNGAIPSRSAWTGSAVPAVGHIPRSICRMGLVGGSDDYPAPVDDSSDPVPTAGPALRVVSGTVSFRERVALPPGAVVTVRVADISLADAPAVILAQNAIEVTGQVPVPFELAVDATDVDERADIAVWARLRSAVGTWVSDTHTPVLSRGAGDTADVVVRRTTADA
jgi:uncharacterized lipoprotein YbaY